MPSHAHDEGDLYETATVHVSYELRMMAAMAVSWVVGEGGDVAATALFESTLTHLRNLDEFITASPPSSRQRYWEHQVCAHHYLHPHWAPIVGLPDPTYKAISRKVSHIYCDRAAPAYQWPPGEAPMVAVCLQLLASFGTFLEMLTGAGLDDRRAWFQPSVDGARQVLEDSGRGLFVFSRA